MSGVAFTPVASLIGSNAGQNSRVTDQGGSTRGLGSALPVFSSNPPASAQTATAVQAVASGNDLGFSQSGASGGGGSQPGAAVNTAAIVTPTTAAFDDSGKLGGGAVTQSVLEYQPSTGRFVEVAGGNPTALAPPPSITYNGGAQNFALSFGGKGEITVHFDPKSGTFQSLPAGEPAVEFSYHPHQQIIVQLEPNGQLTTLAYDALTQAYVKVASTSQAQPSAGSGSSKSGSGSSSGASGSASKGQGGTTGATPVQASGATAG